MSWTKQELKTVALRTGVLFLIALIVFEVAMGLLRPSPDEHDAVLRYMRRYVLPALRSAPAQ